MCYNLLPRDTALGFGHPNNNGYYPEWWSQKQLVPSMRQQPDWSPIMPAGEKSPTQRSVYS